MDYNKELFYKLINELETMHPDLYRKASKNQILDFINSLKDSFTYNEYIQNLMILFAMIGDPHTRLIYNSNGVFSFEFLDDGVYLTENDISDDFLFKKLTAINGIPINQIIERLQRYVSYDNNAKKGYNICELIGNESLLKILLNADNIILDFNNTLVNYSDLCANKTVEDKKRNLFYFDADTDIFNIKLEIIDDKSANILDYINSLEKELDNNHYENVCIDLRGNTGGQEHYFASVLERLKGENIVVLVNQATYSSAAKILFNIQKLGAVTIGSEVGQCINHFGNCKKGLVDDNGLSCFCSTLEYVKLCINGSEQLVSVSNEVSDKDNLNVKIFNRDVSLPKRLIAARVPFHIDVNLDNSLENKLNNRCYLLAKKVFKIKRESNLSLKMAAQLVNDMEIGMDENLYRAMGEKLRLRVRELLEIIISEYGNYFSEQSKVLCENLRNSHIIYLEKSTSDYMQKRRDNIINSDDNDIEKSLKLNDIETSLVSGSDVFGDGLIHICPTILSGKMDSKLIYEKCQVELIRELLSYFIKPSFSDRELNQFLYNGLVDMCVRDIITKYNISSNYLSSFSDNVLYVRNALANLDDDNLKGKIIFDDTSSFFEKTSSNNFNSYEEAKKTIMYLNETNEQIKGELQSLFRRKINLIASLFNDSLSFKQSFEDYLMNKSANFKALNDAFLEINKIALKKKMELDGLTKQEMQEILDRQIESPLDPAYEECKKMKKNLNENKKQSTNISLGYVSVRISLLVGILLFIIMYILISYITR